MAGSGQRLIDGTLRTPDVHWRLSDGTGACDAIVPGERLTEDTAEITCPHCQDAAALADDNPQPTQENQCP